MDQDLVQDPAFEAFILLLVVRAERLTKDQASYSIDSAVTHVMPRYPTGLLPFADDTGGNRWAFDYRAYQPLLPWFSLTTNWTERKA